MNKYKYLLLICLLLLFGCAPKENQVAPIVFDLLIGTYTGEGSKSKGIYVYTFDSETGILTYKNETTDIDNPSFLTISPDQKSVYAISESRSDPVGSVYAYGYDANTGKLTLKNKASAGGKGPCYVSIDQSGKYVFTANYGSGSLAAVPVMPDGSLGSAVQEIYNRGNMINGKEGPSRMHAAVITPDNNYLIAPNLGIDKIGVYQFDSKVASHPLKPADPEFVSLPLKTGPRHFTFHPNGTYGYLIGELDGTITAFDYKAGVLTQTQSISMIPQGFEGTFGAADIHISPDGKFLYGSNRIGLNELVIFSIDQKNGGLTFVGREPSKGKIPRNFTIDPTGNFLLVANQDTDDVHVFKRNKETGLLTATDHSIIIGRPVCLIFVN